MELDKQKIIQILTVLVMVFSFILLGLFGDSEGSKMDIKNLLEINNYQEIDDKFLELLENQHGLRKEELKTFMELNPGKTLREILDEKGIEFRGSERD